MYTIYTVLGRGCKWRRRRRWRWSRCWAAARHSIKLSVCFWIYVQRFVLNSLHKLRLMVFHSLRLFWRLCCWHLSQRKSFQTVCACANYVLDRISSCLLDKTGRYSHFNHLNRSEIAFRMMFVLVSFKKIASFGNGQWVEAAMQMHWTRFDYQTDIGLGRRPNICKIRFGEHICLIYSLSIDCDTQIIRRSHPEKLFSVKS